MSFVCLFVCVDINDVNDVSVRHRRDRDDPSGRQSLRLEPVSPGRLDETFVIPFVLTKS